MPRCRCICVDCDMSVSHSCRELLPGTAQNNPNIGGATSGATGPILRATQCCHRGAGGLQRRVRGRHSQGRRPLGLSLGAAKHELRGTCAVEAVEPGAPLARDRVAAVLALLAAVHEVGKKCGLGRLGLGLRLCLGLRRLPRALRSRRRGRRALAAAAELADELGVARGQDEVAGVHRLPRPAPAPRPCPGAGAGRLPRQPAPALLLLHAGELHVQPLAEAPQGAQHGARSVKTRSPRGLRGPRLAGEVAELRRCLGRALPAALHGLNGFGHAHSELRHLICEEAFDCALAEPRKLLGLEPPQAAHVLHDHACEIPIADAHVALAEQRHRVPGRLVQVVQVGPSDAADVLPRLEKAADGKHPHEAQPAPPRVRGLQHPRHEQQNRGRVLPDPTLGRCHRQSGHGVPSRRRMPR
mmetsp:Transcript_50095/g.151769  ORF Transcript_50095/g.151769 Transcript_50095/m.151769 type:complete len:413 (-) Transcript_50095:818-2056(-)